MEQIDQQQIRLAYNRSTGCFHRLPTPVNINVYQISEEIPSNSCYICLEDIDPNQRLILKNCRCKLRAYCLPCLIQWLHTSTTCPICKETIINVWFPTTFDLKSHFIEVMRKRTAGHIHPRVVEKMCRKTHEIIDMDFSYRLEMNAEKSAENMQEALDFVSNDNLLYLIDCAVQNLLGIGIENALPVLGEIFY